MEDANIVPREKARQVMHPCGRVAELNAWFYSHADILLINELGYSMRRFVMISISKDASISRAYSMKAINHNKWSQNRSIKVHLPSWLCTRFFSGFRCFKEGYIWSGYDTSVSDQGTAASPHACQKICQEDTECGAFEFRKSTTMCKLKTKFNVTESGWHISGPKYCP